MKRLRADRRRVATRRRLVAGLRDDPVDEGTGYGRRQQAGRRCYDSRWEFTLALTAEIVDQELDGHIDFVAHNVKDMDFGGPVFASHTVRETGGVPVAIIGQLFHTYRQPGSFHQRLDFGIQERELQEKVDEVRRRRSGSGLAFP